MGRGGGGEGVLLMLVPANIDGDVLADATARVVMLLLVRAKIDGDVLADATVRLPLLFFLFPVVCPSKRGRRR